MPSMTTQEANVSSSTSSSFTYTGKAQWASDVFISFRAKDTGKNFTSHLYHALCEKGLQTFIKHDLEEEELSTSREQGVSATVLEAIENSTIAMIIFSKNYAYSTACLDELVKILDCRQLNGRLVWPIFYDVEPSEVRKQTGSFGKAFAKHEENSAENASARVQGWRSALQVAANLSGKHLGNGHQANFIRKIVEEVLTNLNRTSLLSVAPYPVGMEYHMREMNLLLSKSSKLPIIGIYGIGGIGKTTVAKAFYNNLADQFEGSCFLADIRENAKKRNGLLQLQKKLLFEMIGDKQIQFSDMHRGLDVITSWLHHKRVLIVLDDVDQCEHLEALVGDGKWFGTGSIIILTTREASLLASHEVERVYEVKELNYNDSIQLFSWYAFKKRSPAEDYKELANRAVNNARGIPSALKLLGSKLFGRNISQWKSELDKLERFPKK